MIRSKDVLIRNAIWKTALLIVLTLAGISMIIPFLWMLSSSFKYNREIFVYPVRWIPETFRFSNYREVWTKIHFLTYYLNTLKLAVAITFGQLLTCSLAAYSFSKLNYRGRDKLFLIYLATMMIPWHAIMIPQFLIVKSVGLFGTSWSIILLQIFSPFGVFLLRQSMLSIPNELSQAARIDGCNEFMIYARIILPLTKAGLATLTIFTFTFVWNDYLGPMIYLDSDKLKTIQLGLTYFRTQYSAEYGLIMAGTVCSLVPLILVYAFAQKYLIDGIAFSGLKG
jgi:multiple sugar transport system permease protein